MPTLNWLGREKMADDLRQVALRILREDRALSHHAEDAGHSDNILVHGDNLEALKALLPFDAGRVRCIYIDPPYNTGSAFEHYDDNLEHATWLNMMYPRLKLLREFLREDGSIWISIDDAEKRAAICGVGVDEMRKGVKAILLKAVCFQTGLTGLTGLGGNPVNPVVNLVKKRTDGAVATSAALTCLADVMNCVPPESRKLAMAVLKRGLEIATDAGDLVLDSFLGSGTTAAVAHKMGRRWIGIEMGDHARTHCAVRMRKVVDGEPGGISKAVKWRGGGGFRFYELGEPILKPDGTLTADIPFEVMAAHVWWRETGTPWEGLVGRKGKSPVLGVHGAWRMRSCTTASCTTGA